MNNPKIPLSNYFKPETLNKNNQWNTQIENNDYLSYIKKTEYLNRNFKPASNLNNDYLTGKIGGENVNCNRIPYSYFDEQINYPKKEDIEFNYYQKDFNDYNQLNKKIYNLPLSSNLFDKEPEYEPKPIRTLDYDRINYIINDQDNRKLTSKDYEEYFNYLNKKQIPNHSKSENNIFNPSNIYKDNDKLQQVNTIQYEETPKKTKTPFFENKYTPQSITQIKIDSHQDQSMNINEYRKMLREREQQANRMKYNVYYNKMSTYRRSYSPQIPEREFNSKDYNRGIGNFNTLNEERKERYSPLMINMAKKNLVNVNPYTEKKMDIGPSQLEINPILYPINSYHFDYNKLNEPNWREKRVYD